MNLAATTVTIDGAFLTAFCAVVAILLSVGYAGYVKLRNSQKVIHDAVNSNMNKALDRIEQLQIRVEDQAFAAGNAGRRQPSKSRKKPAPKKPR